jgi:hypothetical protein
VPVAYNSNPSYLGGRNQEDCGSKAARANSSRDSILKKSITKKRAGGVAQVIGPEFKLQYREKKKKVGKCYCCTLVLCPSFYMVKVRGCLVFLFVFLFWSKFRIRAKFF